MKINLEKKIKLNYVKLNEKVPMTYAVGAAIETFRSVDPSPEEVSIKLFEIFDICCKLGRILFNLVLHPNFCIPSGFRLRSTIIFVLLLFFVILIFVWILNLIFILLLVSMNDYIFLSWLFLISQVDFVHNIFCKVLTDTFEIHKQDYGWCHKTLKIV